MKKSTIALSLLLIAYTAYHVWLNGLFPYINDDFFYQYIVMYNLDEPVTSVKDILQSQYLHYNNINGRSIIHAVEQFVLLLSPDKGLFNILNAMVWTALLSMIVIYAVPRDKRSWIYWIIAIVYLRFMSANSAYLAFWASGSFNYYWCMLATLAFLFVYRQKRPRCAPYLYPLYFIFALLIGWSHETLATGIIVATCIEYFLQKEYKHPLPTVVLAGLLIGYSIMVFAPGNFVKLEAVRQDGAASSFMLALTTAIQFKMIFILLLTLSIGYFKQREATLNYISHNLFLIITAGVNMLFCMAIGVGGRAIFFAETTALILILRYLSTCVSGLNRVSIKWLIPAFAILIAYEVCYACDWKKIYTPINRAIESYIQHDTTDDYITADTNQPMPITAHTILSSGQFWAEHYDFGTISAIYGRPFRILPTSIHRLIKEGSIFSPENRLNEGLEFYTTDSIDFMIMPCDSTPEPVEYIYHLHTPSALDPDIDLLGLLRRKVAPHSYPTTYTPENYSAHPAMPFCITGKHYIILQKPPYRQVKGVYCKPRQ